MKRNQAKVAELTWPKNIISGGFIQLSGGREKEGKRK